MTDKIENSIFPLVNKLKKQFIQIKNLQKGDFVITDNIFWEVNQVHKENHGFVTVLDINQNGFMMSPGDEICAIINRSCFGA